MPTRFLDLAPEIIDSILLLLRPTPVKIATLDKDDGSSNTKCLSLACRALRFPAQRILFNRIEIWRPTQISKAFQTLQRNLTLLTFVKSLSIDCVENLSKHNDDERRLDKLIQLLNMFGVSIISFHMGSSCSHQRWEALPFSLQEAVAQLLSRTLSLRVLSFSNLARVPVADLLDVCPPGINELTLTIHHPLLLYADRSGILVLPLKQQQQQHDCTIGEDHPSRPPIQADLREKVKHVQSLKIIYHGLLGIKFQEEQADHSSEQSDELVDTTFSLLDSPDLNVLFSGHSTDTVPNVESLSVEVNGDTPEIYSLVERLAKTLVHLDIQVDRWWWKWSGQGQHADKFLPFLPHLRSLTFRNVDAYQPVCSAIRFLSAFRPAFCLASIDAWIKVSFHEFPHLRELVRVLWDVRGRCIGHRLEPYAEDSVTGDDYEMRNTLERIRLHIPGWGICLPLCPDYPEQFESQLAWPDTETEDVLEVCWREAYRDEKRGRVELGRIERVTNRHRGLV